MNGGAGIRFVLDRYIADKTSNLGDGNSVLTLLYEAYNGVKNWSGQKTDQKAEKAPDFDKKSGALWLRMQN